MRGGLVIREARKRAGLTQAELGERLGTSQPVVARWEGGRAEPGFATVGRAVRACGLELQVAVTAPDDHDLLLAEELLSLTPRERVDRLADSHALAQRLRSARPVP